MKTICDDAGNPISFTPAEWKFIEACRERHPMRIGPRFTPAEWKHREACRERYSSRKTWSRHKPRPVPRHDQSYFTVSDLMNLQPPWPYSRALIYKILSHEPNKILTHDKGVKSGIDTTKRYKRRYDAFMIDRAVKEKWEKKLGLPVGGKIRAA